MASQDKWVKWTNLAAICGIWSTMLAVLAVSIASPLYLGAKIDNFRSDMYQEMKDFHGRLEKHDAIIDFIRK